MSNRMIFVLILILGVLITACGVFPVYRQTTQEVAGFSVGDLVYNDRYQNDVGIIMEIVNTGLSYTIYIRWQDGLWTSTNYKDLTENYHKVSEPVISSWKNWSPGYLKGDN